MHIYPNKAICFRSHYSLHESIERLSRSIAKNNFIGRLKGGVLGTVTSDKVILQHLSPFRFYAGFLRFKGAFSEDRGTVNLEGKFEINNPFLMNVWFIVSIIFFVLPYIFHTSELTSLSLLTFSVLMLIIWLFVIFIGYRRVKIDDIEKISATITDALS